MSTSVFLAKAIILKVTRLPINLLLFKQYKQEKAVATARFAVFTIAFSDEFQNQVMPKKAQMENIQP